MVHEAVLEEHYGDGPVEFLAHGLLNLLAFYGHLVSVDYTRTSTYSVPSLHPITFFIRLLGV